MTGPVSTSAPTADGAKPAGVWILSLTFLEPSQAVALIAPAVLSADKSGIAGKPISLWSDWKRKAIGPTLAERASACSIREFQPQGKPTALASSRPSSVGHGTS